MMKLFISSTLLLMTISSHAVANSRNDEKSISILASGVIKIQPSIKKLSCIFEYGANFQVKRQSQISHNKWGALLTAGNSDQLSINPESGWTKVYLAKDNYELIYYDAKNPQLVSVINRLENAEIELATHISNFEQLSGNSTLEIAKEACKELLSE